MVGGPGLFRFFLQPTVAVILGVVHGLRDRRAGRPAYLAGLIHTREGRADRLREGVRAIAVPLGVAFIAAFTFQYIIRSRIFVGYAALFATVFVFIPYVIARGLANRLAGRRATTPPRSGVQRGGPRWTDETRNPV